MSTFDEWTKEMCMAHLALHGARFVLAVVSKKGNLYSVLMPPDTLLIHEARRDDRIEITRITRFRGRWREIDDPSYVWYRTDVLRRICAYWEEFNALS